MSPTSNRRRRFSNASRPVELGGRRITIGRCGFRCVSSVRRATPVFCRDALDLTARIVPSCRPVASSPQAWKTAFPTHRLGSRRNGNRRVQFLIKLDSSGRYRSSRRFGGRARPPRGPSGSFVFPDAPTERRFLLRRRHWIAPLFDDQAWRCRDAPGTFRPLQRPHDFTCPSRGDAPRAELQPRPPVRFRQAGAARAVRSRPSSSFRCRKPRDSVLRVRSRRHGVRCPADASGARHRPHADQARGLVSIVRGCPSPLSGCRRR